MANILVRTVRSVGDGTFREKLAVRRHELHWAILHRFDWIPFYLGRAPWQVAIKAWYLRRWGAKIGKRLYMERAVGIKGAEDLRIGDDVAIGSFTYINAGGGLTIEDNVNISTGCRIVCVSHKVSPVGVDYRYAPCWSAPITLKKGCWLATNAIVLPGVTIGEGAVVIAGSLVTKDVPDWAFVGGMPAKFIMYREGYKPPQAKAEPAATSTGHAPQSP